MCVMPTCILESTCISTSKIFVNSMQAILRLVNPIENMSRNITSDNWHSSVELKKWQLTYFGTMKKNKQFIPPSFLLSKKREKNSSMYGFTEYLTLLSHIPKKSKAIVLIFSLHHGLPTDKTTGKPEIISVYNTTKWKMDTVDTFVYSCYCHTKRYPITIFFTIINLSAGVNACLIQCFQRHTKTH